MYTPQIPALNPPVPTSEETAAAEHLPVFHAPCGCLYLGFGVRVFDCGAESSDEAFGAAVLGTRADRELSVATLDEKVYVVRELVREARDAARGRRVRTALQFLLQ